MIEVNKSINDLNVTLIAIKMGNDINISILGGDTPHIGAVALAIPRPSLYNNGEISTSISLLTVVGHKEDEIAMSVAKRVSKEVNGVVSVSCGIHKDNITLDEIKIFIMLVNQCAEEVLNKIK